MRYFPVVLIFMLSGCAYFGGKAQDSANLDRERSIARTRLEAEAGAVPGAYVCKKYGVGIGSEDWVKGTVAEAKQGSIRVKIDEPGSFPHLVNGAEISKGSLVWDNVMGWRPCVKALATDTERE